MSSRKQENQSENPTSGGAPSQENVKKQENQGQDQAKRKIDIFWMSKVFDKPEAIIAYKRPPLAELIADCAFALDANVLLAPFLIGTQSVSNIETIYKGLSASNRLFAPAQAVREYGRNRARKVADVYSQIYERLSSLPSIKPLNTPMLEGIAEYENLKKIGENIKESIKQYKATLTTLKLTLADWTWDDRVSELYRAIFPAEKIADHALTEQAIKEDLARRHLLELPPGYKDKGKADDGIGDVLIWHTLIELSKNTGRDVMFVCNDEKADWFVRSNNEMVMPRLELRHEFYQSTGRYFSMMSWAQFLEAMHATPETIREAEVAQDKTRLSGSFTEFQIHQILDNVRSIFENFLKGWAGDPENTSYGGNPFILDSDFDNLVRSFQHAVIEYERSRPNIHLINSYFHKMTSLLGETLGVNNQLQYIEAKGKYSGDTEREQLVARCKQFCLLHDEYLKWRATLSG